MTATAPRPDTPLTASERAPDPNDVRRATRAPQVLQDFNLAGVLSPADVHAAATLCRLAGDERPEVLLAAALAVRAPQHGHVCVELARAADSVAGDDDAPLDVADLTWPGLDGWLQQLNDSPLVSVRPHGTPKIEPAKDRPLSLVGERLYLDRYWRYERRVAEVLRVRAGRMRHDVDHAAVRAALDRLLPPGEERPDRQRLAVATGALRELAVIAGGPGTGKTYTVARLLALVLELAGDRRARIAVAAPTGKAADRLTQELRAATAPDELDTSEQVRERLRRLEATTIHRLLGWNPGSHTRFKHDRSNKLPYEVVVIDETSMVDLALMAKLVVALRPHAQLVLVGDPDQLESVEAGAVLGDIVGPTGDTIRVGEQMRQALDETTGEPLDDAEPPAEHGIDDAIVVLGTVRRYAADSGIAALATAVHAGDPEAAIEALRADQTDIRWIETPAEARSHQALAPIRTTITGTYTPVLQAAQDGDAQGALEALAKLKVLCAHRRGPVGVAGWVTRIEGWLAEDLDGFDATGRWYVGQPVLVTQNERRLSLWNGDLGVVVRDDELRVAFPGPDGPRTFGPSRLEHIDTVHAMTIHKSQGSQFEHVVVVLPDATSPILTRELLYTAVTRATDRITIVGEEASLRHGIQRRVARASGLRETLWGPGEVDR